MCSCQLPHLIILSMLSIEQKLYFHVLMAAIQIPESVCGLMITVCSNSFETFQSPKCCLLFTCINREPKTPKFENDD